MRSDHLDSLVWLLLEAATEDERKTYRSREVEARKILKQLRIDPDTPTVLTYSYVESSGTTGTSSNAVTEMVNENSTSSKNKNLEWINTKLSHRPVSRDGRDSSKCRSTVDDPDQFRISCEFCAGTDHLYTDCPHDLHPEKVLAQSDSDSDSDSTGSMEYE